MSHICAVQFYSVIDSSDGFYTNTVAREYRSRTAVPFRILGGDSDLEALFSVEATKSGLHELSGHHTCGGLRVCIYNGIPDEGLDQLMFFMVSFQEKYHTR